MTLPHALWILFDATCVEVVLSDLIGSFKFSSSDKEIVWNMGGYPTVGYASDKPSMPVKVEVVD